MSKASKFTEEQKLEIALELMAGKLSLAEICRKHGISSAYAYRLKDRAIEVLRKGIAHPPEKEDQELVQLRRRVTDLEELAGDQALVIRYLKKNPK